MTIYVFQAVSCRYRNRLFMVWRQYFVLFLQCIKTVQIIMLFQSVSLHMSPFCLWQVLIEFISFRSIIKNEKFFVVEYLCNFVIKKNVIKKKQLCYILIFFMEYLCIFMLINNLKQFECKAYIHCRFTLNLRQDFFSSTVLYCSFPTSRLNTEYMLRNVLSSSRSTCK